mmetsp:Transcript_2951/g.10351  ORF Transcript_2951/g.10351 Transcript_2951/m.10351 type:complete len:334 (+) Transcript_2951:116-1117(+)|eukprot:CAMPEP_0114628282 /NCGR_PEP_ID=MMETSP0168-20121206/12738_1 /TAXON_ID=95228 ORGANISM="Vannella sp., Strain DIVA3 517/6/12" /NCGR_SAMPLE_ID=MMETSP0168 /ASSEMBLY_ACC=CAM_ASM_000044 /LENGTH=333 /DNA_ID=CAMNT_0001839655 /DNA_START=85 /DNA_END=1086 /DNA_ORIENTATION=+
MDTVREVIVRQWSLGECPEHPLKYATDKYIVTKSISLLTQDQWMHLFALAIGLFLLRIVLNKLVLLPLVKLIGGLEHEYDRWLECMWQLLFYLCAWLLCSWAVSEETFFTETWRCWEPPFPNQTMSPSIYWLYMLEMGWYLYGAYAHVFIEPRKRDFWEMLLHHIAAFFLLYMSLNLGYWRVGTLVLYSLDLCDVYMQACKMLRLLDNCRPVGEVLKSLMFVVLVLAWLYFRIALYAAKVIYTTAYVPLAFAGYHNCDYYFAFNGLVIFVWLLQIFWFYLIVKVAYLKVKFGMELDDARDFTAQKNLEVLEELEKGAKKGPANGGKKKKKKSA